MPQLRFDWDTMNLNGRSRAPVSSKLAMENGQTCIDCPQGN